MTVPNYKNDYDYARSRLEGSVVMLEGVPIYITEIWIDCGSVRGTNCLTGDMVSCHVKDLNLEPVPLGYVNNNDYAIYTCRTPARKYKQGLSRYNFYTFSPHLGAGVKFNSSYVARTIVNQFPKILDCAESVFCQEKVSAAFSRDFSIIRKNKKLSLLFRDKLVGSLTWSPDKSYLNPHLNKDRLYLGELLEGSLNA